MPKFEHNAILRGAQLTLVGGRSLSSLDGTVDVTTRLADGVVIQHTGRCRTRSSSSRSIINRLPSLSAVG